MCVSNNIFIFAHEEVLNVFYDDCTPPTLSSGEILTTRDSEDETWYCLLEQNDKEHHISHTVDTIKYYFEEYSEDGSGYAWTTDIYNKYIETMSHEDALSKAQTTAEMIKTKYAESMEKWNNVYYYVYDEQGEARSYKIINVVAGSKEDHNLVIYPIDYESANAEDSGGYKACVITRGIGNPVIEFDVNFDPEWDENVVDYSYHLHCSNWKMNVNVNCFFVSSFIDISPINVSNNLSYVGQHELGHILGLGDVDSYCSCSNNANHHDEILMGYGDNTDLTTFDKYAKYQDIAGVSITRGLHTDDDHVWMARVIDENTIDVICALCNGVRYDASVSATDNGYFWYEDKWINQYQSCIHHGGTNEEMRLVATDGIRNFYKCQYCRYIAEIEITYGKTVSMTSGYTYDDDILAYREKYYRLNVLHTDIYNVKTSNRKNSRIELYDQNFKILELFGDDIYSSEGYNVVIPEGVYYIRVTNDYMGKRKFDMSIIPHPHIHNYTEWKYYSLTHHIQSCEYGLLGTITSLHVIKAGTAINNRGSCMYCGAIILLGDDFVQVPGPLNIQKITLNGSYILPNGIIVLVDEDIEAYENGTLVWYDKDKLPQIQ